MVVPRGRHLSFTTRMSRSLSSFIVPRAPDPNRMIRSGSTVFTMLVDYRVQFGLVGGVPRRAVPCRLPVPFHRLLWAPV